jgi:RimJ/RimL family protein N-acetyltransferase
MNIEGKKVVLRAIEQDDLVELQKWANTPEICYMLAGWHFPTSMDDQQNWLKSFNVSSLHQRFAIDTPDLGLIGTANLVDINWKDRNAFHGMLLGDKDVRGKGYGVDTIMAMMKYAFEELGLMRLDGSMIEYNKASLGVYLRKCGWKEEGIQRKWYFRKNQFWDKVIVGVTRDDYFNVVNENNYWEKK